MNRLMSWLFPRWIPLNEQKRAALRRLRMTSVITVLVLTGVSVHAQDLPDKPEPRTADREFWIQAGGMATAWTMDTVSTSQLYAACPTCHEVGGFFNGTQDTTKIMAAWAAVDVGTAVLAYEWKRHVHNRYLHPLWRVPMAISTFDHSRAAFKNWHIKKGLDNGY